MNKIIIIINVFIIYYKILPIFHNTLSTNYENIEYVKNIINEICIHYCKIKLT
jgi:hypothetical protein